MASRTADALRRMLDRGQMRDEVAFNDPAAAPLGTDEEAAGIPLSEADIRKTVRTGAASPRRPVVGGSEPPFWPRAAGVITGAAALGVVLWLALSAL